MKSYKISSYNQFINEAKQSKEDIDSICEQYYIYNYTINEDGTVDVNDEVILIGKGLHKLPLKFGEVTGYFSCSDNYLTSLEGSPKKVGGGFYCDKNQLTSLKGCPENVGGDFACDSNKLITLEGGPKEINDDFKYVFSCSYNELTSLKGSPKKVGSFYCNNNQLTSLEGGPEEVNDVYDCSNNEIKDVKGFPKIIKNYIYLSPNPVYEVINYLDVDENRWVEVAEYLNEYNVIRDGNKVVLQALELVYDELGLEVPEGIYISGYEII